MDKMDTVVQWLVDIIYLRKVLKLEANYFD